MKISMQPKIIRSRRRTLAIQILPDATLVVKVPLFTPMIFINKFINQNLEWIENKLDLVRKQKTKTGEYGEGDLIFFLGNEYAIKYGDYTNIALKEKNIFIPTALRFRIKKELTNWYIKHARVLITKQVEYYSEQMKAPYVDLKFSDTKSQWGRCTHDNKLQFNWRLIMASMLVINYVVVHELAHTIEKNHSRAFWSKVRLYNPSYRQQIKWLKENSQLLKI